MPGGIEWFRWFHGSVTDPKFGLVAKNAGVSTAVVIAFWAWLLETASASDDRGNFGSTDFEAIDYLLGLEDGTAHRILDAMTRRGLVADQHIVSWAKRQPKREDDTAAERKRRQRALEKCLPGDPPPNSDESRRVTGGASLVTQRHAAVTPCHGREEETREEETREEKKSPHKPPLGVDGRFEDFWAAWPANDRKHDKAKAAKKWKAEKFDSVADLILADIAVKRQTKKWRDGFVETPLVYLNGKRWEDGVELQTDEQVGQSRPFV